MSCNVSGAVLAQRIENSGITVGHRFDYHTPIEETMNALHDVVKSGKVRYIGMSSCYAWQCKPLSVHNYYSAAHHIHLVHAMQSASISYLLRASSLT